MRHTSTFGKVGLQFYKYPLKQLEVIADFLPQNKKTTFKQKASFWIPYFFACGLMGFLPFFDWGDDKLSKNFNLFPKDFLQKLIMEHLNGNEAQRMIGKVIMYGVLRLPVSMFQSARVWQALCRGHGKSFDRCDRLNHLERGLSTRQISETIEELYGFEVS